MDCLNLCYCTMDHYLIMWRKPNCQQNSVPKYLTEIICTCAFKTFYQKKVLTISTKVKKNLSQCENGRKFLSLGFYVKSIFAFRFPENNTFGRMRILWILILIIFHRIWFHVKFCLTEKSSNFHTVF